MRCRRSRASSGGARRRAGQGLGWGLGGGLAGGLGRGWEERKRRERTIEGCWLGLLQGL